MLNHRLTKRLLSLLPLFLFLSCNQPQKKVAIKAPDNSRKIDPILREIFKKKFPNYVDNQMVRSNAESELEHKIDSVLPLGYLNDIPLKAFRINKNPHGKGALVQFYTDNFDSDKQSRLSDRLNFDIIGFIDEKEAASLKEDKTYLVYGKKLKRLTETETFILVNQVYYSPRVEVSKDAIWDVFNFNIGDILCEIDSVKPYKSMN